MLLSRNTSVSTSNLTEFYKLLRTAGWQAIDLNETCNPNKFLLSYDEQLSFVKSVLFEAEKADLYVGQCHAPMAETYKDKTQEEIESRIQSAINCTRITGELSIPCTIVHPFIYSWSEEDPDPSRTLELNANYLKRVCEVQSNTTVCLENMPGSRGFIKDGYQLKKMCDEVGNNLCVCLDTGHAFSNGLKASHFFEILGDKIKALHVHDTLLGMDKHMLPYLGVGDWNDFKETIKKYNYKGTLNSESGFSEHLPNEKQLEAETFERKIYETLL